MKGSGISFLTVLFLIFLTLKISKIITWSWWWIFSPLWIPIAISVIVILIILLIYAATHKNIKTYENK